MRRRGTGWRAGMLLALAAAVGFVGLGVTSPAVAASPELHGVVTDRGRAVAGVRVGYLDPTTGAGSTTRTDARGRFTIEPPGSPGTGFVWAGSRPTAPEAVFTASGTGFVRAVIGATRPKGAPSALLQTQRAATPSTFSTGGTIAIRLQRSAKLAGSDRALAGARIVLHRGDGSVVRSVAVGASGRYRSPALAPGRYPARLILPGAAASTAIADVVLRPGGATALAPGVAGRVRDRQSVVTGTVVSPEGVAPRRVRVEARQDGDLVAAVRSTTAGRYVFRGLPPGTYTLLAGRNAPDHDADPSRVHLTPDDTVSVTRSVVARAATTTRRALPLGLAGRISGTTTAFRIVLVEDVAGRLVRTAPADAQGRFTAGGLTTGDYTVITTGGVGYGAVGASVVAGRTTAVGDLQSTTPLLTARGTVPAAALAPGEHLNVAPDIDGAVPGYDTAFGWATGGTEPDASGAWTIGSLIPGRYTFGAGSYLSTGRTDDSLGHADGPRVTRSITPATAADAIALGLGPRNGLLAGLFRAKGGPGIGYFPSAVTAADGTTAGISGNAFVGDIEVVAPPGRYRWGPGGYDVAVATDGPWWAIPTDRSLTIEPGVHRGVAVPLTAHG